MKTYKYQALGNDYLVIDPIVVQDLSIGELAKCICNRKLGIGSDGILIGPYNSDVADFKLRIINPDGSEAEKSGNGLRIFCKFLHDQSLISFEPFTIETNGGIVICQVLSNDIIKVEMGKLSFNSSIIGITGREREVIKEPLVIQGTTFELNCTSIGNPHCVILSDDISEHFCKKYGPIIEKHPMFLNSTNIQFLKVINRSTIKIVIWERGAGYTLSSGSSSVAAAGIAKKLGFCDNQVKVEMPGGHLDINFTDNYEATMTGPALKVADCEYYFRKI